ncbi:MULTISPECIES: cytochrome P450 [Thermomonosporaceae]|uniref:cytochrome P450 n=1 Tax=Thermomonosporaceae TaxID=2012 RepID=UPI00255B04C1|nr:MULTISPECIES: cytochrome P450 [Thermomonosporaceae]MDL4775243.1 cytochrome P450 [Actinomadura xylanilytica]
MGDAPQHLTAGGYLDRYETAAERDPLQGLGLLAGWLRAEWRSLFAELRARRPILRTPAFTLVTRFPDVAEVLQNGDVFTVSGYASRLEPAVGGPVMLTRDGTSLNWREKGLMQVMLPPEDVPRVRALVARTADRALDAAVPRGRIDAVGELFRPVCTTVCAEYFGLSGPDPGTLARWSRAIMTDATANLVDDPAIHAASLAAGRQMMDHLRGELDGRRAEGTAAPGGDVFARLLRTVLPDELAWDDDRITINVAGLLLGFLENGVGSMTHLVRQLLLRPEVLRTAVLAASDRDTAEFDRHVWEALRFDPFLKVIIRVCAREYVLAAGTPRETLVPAGTPVLAAVASAMFDETAVPEPDRFRTDRPPHPGWHFGHGPHACVGVHPGAAVISEAVRRLVLRPGLRLLDPPEGAVVRDRDVFPDRFWLGLGDGEG